MLSHRWPRLCSVGNGVVCNGRKRVKWSGTLMGRAGDTDASVGAAARRRLCHGGSGHFHEDESVRRFVRRLVEEHGRLSRELHRPSLSEADRRLLVRRHAELLPLASAFHGAERAAADLEEVSSLLRSSAGSEDEDRQLTQLLREEEAQIAHRIAALRRDLIKALVPSDPLDSSNVMLEVVSGRTTGGDICQQFTKEMFDMYQGYALYKNWEFETLNYTDADYGGLHHAAVRIAGENVYRHLKHEGGTHRVQRIPEVGLSSRMQRIHTGTMTVIVLPQPTELDVVIDRKDLRIDTFRSRGAGGQSVNTTDSAVRVVHLPTGVTAECQETRSQLQNRERALRMLRARLYQSMMGKETEQRHRARKQQVGTRSQSERIRTYNFSQDRVTDHRTGYATRDIKEFMKGGEPLDRLVSDVLEHSEKEALLELVESSGLQQP